LAVLLIFSSKTSKFRHSVTKKRQLLGDFVLQTPYRGFAPGPHWGTSVQRRPGPPPFAHSKYATVSCDWFSCLVASWNSSMSLTTSGLATIHSCRGRQSAYSTSVSFIGCIVFLVGLIDGDGVRPVRLSARNS